MDFPTYFRILKKYLGDGATIPEFFRELIEMITEDGATYELPLAWEVTTASEGEPTVAKRLIRNMGQRTMERAKYLMADRGYSGFPLQNLIE